MLKSGIRNTLSRITYQKLTVVEILKILVRYNDANCRSSHLVKLPYHERKLECVSVCATLKFETGPL